MTIAERLLNICLKTKKMTILSPLTQSFLQAIQTDSLPSLGPNSRPGVKSRGELLELADAFCKANGIEENTRRLLQSAALLWHDDLDGSHEISQGIQTADGSFLHGIMHRREPDNSNAKYWFRRVGDHPSFPALAVAVRDFAAANPPESQALGKSGKVSGEFDFVSSLIPNGRWDAFAFVDACHRAMKPTNSLSAMEIQKPLQKIQELEFQTLLNHFLS